MMRLATLLGSLLLVVACVGEGGDGEPVDEAEGCPVDSMYYAEHCGETYCGGPDVEVGTGFDRFIELDEGDEIDVMFGSQGGYHLDVSARMTRLCPIVYLRASVWLDRGDGGDLEEIFGGDRHVEALRTEPDGSSLQEFWGVRAFVPCRHWPSTTLSCSGGAGSDGRIDDYEVVIRLEAEDHNGRVGTDERRVQPACCG